MDTSRLLVMGDFSGGSSKDRKDDLEDRKLRSVSGKNIDSLMEDMKMSVSFTVPNMINPDVEADQEPAVADAVRVGRVSGRVGGGTLPTASVASWAVRLGGISATTLARHLRAADAPVVARIEDDVVWLDARTLREDEVAAVARSAAWALEQTEAAT